MVVNSQYVELLSRTVRDLLEDGCCMQMQYQQGLLLQVIMKEKEGSWLLGRLVSMVSFGVILYTADSDL